MLIPESKSDKEIAEIERCVAWVAKLPKEQQHMYCEHGRYWGAHGALDFMSKCCKPEKQEKE